ncbi:MAG: 50S ribosomal protein L11 methyltransferase [Kiritimatiellae bacterium]|nr:50S ribosomal protein L11 methyltransferase [Kiritimatiellia bacterium]
MTVVICTVADRFVNPLFEVFDGGDFILSSYRDVEADGNTEMRIYFPDPSDAPAAKEALINAGRILDLELDPREETFPDEDWTLAYRRHFKTEVISPRLVIRPPWEEYTPVEGQKVLTLDPGMAFGTGQHATTRACLEFIDDLAKENTDRTFLDIGCGSGILGVAAALEGFKGVAGFDIDPEAVKVANETALQNGVEEIFTRGDLCNISTLPDVKSHDHRHDVVAANVLGPVLINFADEIVRTVHFSSESRLILSGILDELFPEVVEAYAKRNFRLVESKTIGEWTSGLFAPDA